MTFNSPSYLGFFPLVVAIYFVMPARVRWMWLLLASVFFYAVAGPIYVLQVLAVSLVCYAIALQIEAAGEQKRRQGFLLLSVMLLVGNLFVFKYTAFINESMRAAFGWFQAPYPLPAVELVLPLGISFYTFQLLSYVVDVYRGQKAERHLGIFALYVMLFPKIIAGPIERGRNLLPQLHAAPGFDSVRIIAGLQLMLWGAFKKVVVADRIAPFVNHVYDDPHAVEGVALTFATLLYAFQIYCDFSGYTDMALGAALVLGFTLMANFNRPYFATSIQDFWKRWHISLTSWLTDYIYTPLTRTTSIQLKWFYLMLISLFLTFLVSGLWHGAQWTFVLWGALHGTYIVVSVLLQKPYNNAARAVGLMQRKQLHKGLKIVATFTLVCFAYVLFRANSVADAAHIFTNLHTGWNNPLAHIRGVIGAHMAEFLLALLGIAIVMTPEFFPKTKLGARFSAMPAWGRWPAYYAGIVAVLMLGAHWGNDQQFIYFRF